MSRIWNGGNPLTALVVGAGAIGSYLVGILARDRSVSRLMIVDNDVFETRNAASQDIRPRDIGRPKARVQARRARSIRPDLEVESIVDDVADVALGRLRCDVIFGCLDSRLARLHLNQIAFRLKVPWIDGGVKGDDRLARVQIYSCEPDTPCYECSFGQREYDLLEQSYACGGQFPASAPTNASAGLGALTASLQSIEFRKMAEQGAAYANFGRQIMIDAQTHQHRVSTFLRNQSCRFDHRNLLLEPVDCAPSEMTLGQAFELGRGTAPTETPLTLVVERTNFVTNLECSNAACGDRVDTVRTEESASSEHCAKCGAPMGIAGFGLRDSVERARLSRPQLARSLRSIGFRRGDVFSITGPGVDRHFELQPSEETR